MLTDRVRRAYEAIAKVERVAAQFPGDVYVLANLAALKRDAEELESQWAEAVRLQQKEVCRYRMVPCHDVEFSIRAITRSLLDFQELFSQVYDALKNGAKRRATLGIDMILETTFNFAFSYAGSLGIVMSVDTTPTLFDGQFDIAIFTFMQIVEAKTEADIRDLAKRLGDAVVKKTFDWAKVNVEAGYAVDLDWTTVRGTHKGGMIDLDVFSRLVTVISRTSDTERRSIKVLGILVGLDSKTKRFRFVDPDGADYAGPLSETFPAS
ncbi:MAG: hypothetical protein ABSC06_11065, partial [Rhodopila sp.]